MIIMPGVLNNTASKYSGEFFIDGTKVFIRKVIYNEPYTIVLWSDGSKTTSKCHSEDKFSQETGLMICLFKKFFGTSETRLLLDTWTNPLTWMIDLKDVRSQGK